ncbi:MAG TPA: M20 family metallopeptidase [Thermoplasmata archaeon]|nr:M20 family metallopeptidase [Thermoplasmata archaeon]
MSSARGQYVREARRQLPAMRAWRSAFHREPELSNEEHRTRQKVVQALSGLGIPFRTFSDMQGVVALIGGDRPGPVVALRADMDGLPVTEATGLPFASRFPGRMHACGHDVHLSALLGAAAALRRDGRRLGGPVKLLFQPAEEDGRAGGAGPLIEKGALRDPKVDFVVGQHVAPEFPLGSIGWRAGPFMAAADHFIIQIRGAGGHAGYPHLATDAVLAASEVITSLQALVSRMRDPRDPVVVSVGMIHGGTRHNILPDSVDFEGSVRTVRPITRDKIEAALRRRVRLVAASSGARARIRYERGYPVTVNDPPTTARLVDALGVEFGRERMVEVDAPVMGAEDFSRYLEKVPGAFFFLGVGAPGRSESIHSARFAPPESALVNGAALLLASVDALQRSGS